MQKLMKKIFGNHLIYDYNTYQKMLNFHGIMDLNAR